MRVKRALRERVALRPSTANEFRDGRKWLGGRDLRPERREGRVQHSRGVSEDLGVVSLVELVRQLEALIRRSAALTLAASLLRSIPGIGPVNAAALIALMPELGQRSGKTIAALGGLAPINRDSGQFRGQRSVAGGRAEVRKLLYMAAVTASRSNSRFAATYKALTANGKAAKLALIAVARKLLVTANAILKTAQPFKA